MISFKFQLISNKMSGSYYYLTASELLNVESWFIFRIDVIIYLKIWICFCCGGVYDSNPSLTNLKLTHKLTTWQVIFLKRKDVAFCRRYWKIIRNEYFRNYEKELELSMMRITKSYDISKSEAMSDMKTELRIFA